MDKKAAETDQWGASLVKTTATTVTQNESDISRATWVEHSHCIKITSHNAMLFKTPTRRHVCGNKRDIFSKPYEQFPTNNSNKPGCFSGQFAAILWQRDFSFSKTMRQHATKAERSHVMLTCLWQQSKIQKLHFWKEFYHICGNKSRKLFVTQLMDSFLNMFSGNLWNCLLLCVTAGTWLNSSPELRQFWVFLGFAKRFPTSVPVTWFDQRKGCCQRLKQL